MTVEVGAKTEGKVTGITNFGAFVDLGEGQSGMVHISEIADGYVKDIHDVLSVGDTVKVLVLNEKDHKIALSIKQATDRPKPKYHSHRSHDRNDRKPQQHKPESFDDMMSGFMKESEERLSILKKNTEGKRGGRGGRRS
ncbi:S1 domain-containing RNA-binding protein [Companilactobacillus halodurans]|uniref:RNA-binding protein S1 n=1 Tax=Companilactobacillus halodurans TaxID=2584183 RepID=A0A5P0ZUX7_9LACO|nr:S1 domain-containing RNA-binding protein [Companilactobacillus halodurans]MQS76126.1 RNA-binding protein S1 [Companilactobacillus halodurans]MQS96715.1 RNA-binding protein S1 [Companilactobacillus halodurans]